jgi:DNA primase large subunit
MKFWRAEFAPKCQGEAFDKKYAYNVRYNYAKEGKRTEYTPYSCMKIIQTPVPKVGLAAKCAGSEAPHRAAQPSLKPLA